MSSTFERASRNRFFRRKALALAIGGSVALVVAGGAFAQAVTGTIHGSAPVAPGEQIQITNNAGYNRIITVGPSGRYSVLVPVGTYTVTLLQHGKAVRSHTGVTPVAGGSANASFAHTSGAKSVQTLSAVTVTANAIPPIDVSTTHVATTFTHQQLQELPLGQSAQAIAMMTPGVIQGAASLGTNGVNGSPFLSVGGASTAENAYYIDGMNVTDFQNGQGNTVVLPYFAIQEQQVLTGGYSAKYGRSIGGVVSQIGREGSNQWHFGFRAQWDPRNLEDRFQNYYYENPFYKNVPSAKFVANPAQEKGNLLQYRAADGSWQTKYDAYVSGPIVKNKLFFFLGLERDQSSGNAVGGGSLGGFAGGAGLANNAPENTFFKSSSPKVYLKVNWNINNNNFLTLTGLSSSFNNWDTEYNFNYNDLQTTDFNSLLPVTKVKNTMWVLNYTSYITNHLTLHAMLGKNREDDFSFSPVFPGFDPNLPAVAGVSLQNPAFTPNGPIISSNPTFNVNQGDHQVRSTNYRVSLSYQWRNNTFSAGIDSVQIWDRDDGSIMSGPGYAWLYGQSGANIPIVGTNINTAPFAGAPNSNGPNPSGYWVAKYIFQAPASMNVYQRGYYFQDKWQVTPNFLLNLGIRDDQFTNYNPAGEPFLNLHRPQWAPRIGFSWNVFGDSSLKVFGNAGRYYLDIPASIALRDAGAPRFTEEYGSYTGINSQGGAVGFVPFPENNGHPGISGVSANNEYGEPLNAAEVAAQNIGAEYSDNFSLGVKKQFQMLGSTYVAGAVATYNKLGRIIDDWGDQGELCAAAIAQGVPYPGGAAQCANVTDGSLLFNPATENTFMVPNGTTGALQAVKITPQDQQFPAVKRDYYNLDLSLEHPFNGKWFGKLDVVYSRLWGDEEGPVDSIIGQGGNSVSATEAWDFPQLMQFSNGLLPNDQKWQMIAYGEYAINSQWMVGGTLRVGSGHPVDCLGFFGPGQSDPLGYAGNGTGGAYHWCLGNPSPDGAPVPGSSTFTPWTEQLNLNVQYSPTWADHRLKFEAQMFNVFNQQRPLQLYYGPGQTFAPFPAYLSTYGSEAPRFVRFSVQYDF